MSGYKRQISNAKKAGLMAVVVAAVTACSGNDKPLPGERFTLQSPDPTQVQNQTLPFSMPSAVSNANWTHLNGEPDHSTGHAAFSQTPTLRWSTTIGTGEGRDTKISTTPVAANGKVFVMDGAGLVSAVASNGGTVWQTSVTPVGENPEDGKGGGLSYDNGVLYVGSPYGELIAVDASNGNIRWRRSFQASIRSAPTVAGSTVYVMTGDNVAYGISASNGALIIDKRGPSTLMGGTIEGASVAVSGGQAVIPFMAGSLLAIRTNNSEPIWQVKLDQARPSSAMARLGDIAGAPVINGNSVYAATVSGQIVKLNAASGKQAWSVNLGASGPVWPAGNSLFLVSDHSQIVRMDARSGAVIWSQQLPDYANAEKRKGPIRHYGPILAGGRLWVAGRDGTLRGFAPDSGALVNQIAIPDGAASAPIMMGGVMYVPSLTGQLHAFQ